MESSMPPRSRTSRRSRPSLAAFTDSGYEPSRPSTYSKGKNSLPRLHSMRAADGAAPTPRRGSLFGDLFPDPGSGSRFPSFRGSKGHTMKSRTSHPFPVDGGETATMNGGGTIVGPPHGTIIAAAHSTTGGGASGSGTVSKSGSSSAYPRTNTISRSATISSAWSGVSNRLFMESILGSGNERDANEFTQQFDKLAKKHGIQPFPRDFKAGPTSVSVSSASQNISSGESTPPPMRGNKLWNRLLRRTPSSMDVSKLHGNMKLTLSRKRNNDVSDLAAIGKGKRDSLKGMHLEDMIRLGGVAILNLPLGLSPGDLLIPTCIHATASFLLTNGLRTPGIFRISGNVNTVYALYDHYQKQLEENSNGAVVATTALARLPNHIHYSIHDVAHLFRKLLHGLPGGLLGSPAVFQALYNIHRFVYPDPSLGDDMTKNVKPRMVALAISSINLHFRISLICAVFGLLRAINLASDQDVASKVKDPHELFAQLKDDDLGIVFGPLLLGDKSDHILTEDSEDRGGLLVLASVGPSGKSSSKLGKGSSRHRGFDMGYSKKQLEKTKRAAMVCQMLIDNWEDICYQMKRINTLGATAQAYDLPADAQSQADFKYMYEDPNRSVRGEPKRSPKGLDRSQKGTVRSSTRRGSRTSFHERNSFHEQPGAEHSNHLNHLSTSRIPDLSLTSQFYNGSETELPDLMRFSTSNSENGDNADMPVSGPFMVERTFRTEMPPIVEMPPVRSLDLMPLRALQHPTDVESPEASPNWRVLDDPEPIATPICKTPTTEGTLNWSTAEETPNWKTLTSPEDTPNWNAVASPAGTPNWKAFGTDETPNWKQLAPSPPGTPVQRYQVKYREPAMHADVPQFSADHQRTSSQVSGGSGGSRRSMSLGSQGGHVELFGAATPPMEMTPQAAIKPYNRRPVLAPAFEESPPSPAPSTVDGDQDSVSAPELLGQLDRRTTFGRRAISPVPELSPPQDIMAGAADGDQRPITPKPLSFKKKARGSSFSIFEDKDKTPDNNKARTGSNESPVLTSTKPNSQGEIKLNVKSTKPSPTTRASPDSDPFSRSLGVPLQPSTPNRNPRASLEADFEDRFLFDIDGEMPSPRKLRGNSALYAEIRRLQKLVDAKNEEALQTRRELELAKSMASASTLSQLVRETQEQLKVWRNRAEWAEKQLRERGMNSRQVSGAGGATPGGTFSKGHAHRYSMS